jgi:hypothetical protein
MKEFFGRPGVSQYAKEGVGDLLKQYGKNLEKPALESEGFLYIPADHIRVIPPQETGQHGVVEIYEPAEKIGTEAFDRRDMFEQALPVGDILPEAEWENKVFRGEITPEAFIPEIGGRVCLAVVNLYESKEGTFVMLPVHPPREEKYQFVHKRSGQTKLSGTNMLRGTRFPAAQELLRGAQGKVQNNLMQLQAQYGKDEKVSGKPILMQTGLWDLRFINQKGKYSEVKNCYLQRDAETGTLDALLLSKQFIFEAMDEFKLKEQSGTGVKRVNALVATDALLQAKEGTALNVQKLFYDDQTISRLEDLPARYQGMFEMRDGQIFLKQFKPTPPLKGLIGLENKIVKQTPEDTVNLVREKIGQLFESVAADALGTEKNKEKFEIVVPNGDDLENLLQGQPEAFCSWAREQSGKNISVQPDFILADGTFVEVKSGAKLDLKPEKRAQLFRMVLYKLLKKEPLKIRIISLEGETMPDPVFEQLKYENIFDTELGDKITARDLKPIRLWQEYLPK